MLATMVCAHAHPRPPPPQFPPQKRFGTRNPVLAASAPQLDSSFRGLSTKRRKGVGAKGSEAGGTGEYKSGTVETEVGKLNLLCDTLRARVPTDVGVVLLRHFQDVRRNFFHPQTPPALPLRGSNSRTIAKHPSHFFPNHPSVRPPRPPRPPFVYEARSHV